MEVFETPLPGVGSRYEFTTEAGDRVGVIAHRDRTRDLVVYDDVDPDSCRANIELNGEESSVLVELLGGTKITERLQELHHEIEGLAIEWVTIPPGASQIGVSIGESEIRTTTGGLIVAVTRAGSATLGPGPDFAFAAGDLVLIIGSVDGARAAKELLTR